MSDMCPCNFAYIALHANKVCKDRPEAKFVDISEGGVPQNAHHNDNVWFHPRSELNTLFLVPAAVHQTFQASKATTFSPVDSPLANRPRPYMQGELAVPYPHTAISRIALCKSRAPDRASQAIAPPKLRESICQHP